MKVMWTEENKAPLIVFPCAEFLFLRDPLLLALGEKEWRVLNTSVHFNQESDHASEKKFHVFSAVYCQKMSQALNGE